MRLKPLFGTTLTRRRRRRHQRERMRIGFAALKVMVRCTSRTHNRAGQRRPANNEKSSEFAYFTIYYACVDDGKCDWSCWTNPIAPSSILSHSISSRLARSMPSRHYDKGFARPTFVFYTANSGHVSSVRIYLFSGAASLGECVEDWHLWRNVYLHKWNNNKKKQSGQKRRICGHLRTILVYTHTHIHIANRISPKE